MEELLIHPDFEHPPAVRVKASVFRPAETELRLRFELRGELRDIVLPAHDRGERRDGLWRHSCFEVFIGPDDAPGYHELNLAPSGDWAAYRFSAYREGMEKAPVDAIRTTTRLRLWTRLFPSASRLVLNAAVPRGGLPSLNPRAAWRVGLAAVLEHRDGRKSYWALHHSPGPPDFHHPDCFALQLPSPSAG